MGDAQSINGIPVDLDPQSRLLRNHGHAFRGDRQPAEQRELEGLFRNEKLEILAVGNRAGDMQVGDVHQGHRRRVNLAIHAERLGQTGDLEGSGDARLPRHVGPNDIGRLLGNGLGHPPMTAPRRLGCRDGDIQCRAQLAVFGQFEVPERLFEPDVVGSLQPPTDADGLVHGIVGDRIGKQQVIGTDGIAERLVNSDISPPGPRRMDLVSGRPPLPVLLGLGDIVIERVMEQAAGIGRQFLPAPSEIAVEWQISRAGGNIPQRDVQGSRKIDREEGQMPVKCPQVQPDPLALRQGVPSQGHGSDVFV